MMFVRNLNTPTTKAKHLVLFLNMNTIFKRIQPIGAKGKFPRLCLSSCTGALHAKLCHAATPDDWVELNFDEDCILIKRIYIMCSPRRGFQATLITCIFYLLWVSIIAGRWFLLKIQFIRSVFRLASLRNFTSMFKVTNSRLRANGRNNSQQCCVRLHEAKSLTGFKLCATTSNNMQQGVQTDATCNIQQCWELLANNVASVCTQPNLRGILNYFAKHSRFHNMTSVACYRY